MEKLEQQIILYCKGHFEETDLMEDLKVIIGKYCACEPEHIEDNSVYYWVSQIYFGLHNRQQLLYHFMELFKWTDHHDYKSFIEFMCSHIRGCYESKKTMRFF